MFSGIVQLNETYILKFSVRYTNCFVYKCRVKQHKDQSEYKQFKLGYLIA